MSFDLLIPLGLIALIAIPALIIIYIIKPNFQVKHVASTYVWKLSLKYKRKRIPVSKIRNILLFLCQLLILTAIALIIARPALFYNFNDDRSDVVAIIDSSASMYTQSDGETRFHRAIEDVIDLSDKTLSNNGAMSVILASDPPEALALRYDSRNRSALMNILNEFESGEKNCSYGEADIAGAVRLSEQILTINPAAKIYLYTDTTYAYVPDSIEVVPVTGTAEWNAAILNAEAEVEDGYYTLTVEVACYGKEGMAWPLNVNVQVEGANANLSSEGTDMSFSHVVNCSGGKTETVIFRKGGGEDMEDFFYHDLEDTASSFTSYRSITVSIDEDDCFRDDNSFQIYGGRKPIVRVLYSSLAPNPFFSSGLDILHNDFASVWDVRVTEVRHDNPREPFVTEGYDFYIYEETAPEQLPSDGVVFLVDPDCDPIGAGITKIGEHRFSEDTLYLAAEEEHPIMKNIIAENISVTKFNILTYDQEYRVLMTCDGSPMLLVKDEDKSKIVVMPFNVHYSNIAVEPEWYIMLYNVFKYFIPGLVEGNSFEVGEQIIATPRGSELTAFDANGKQYGEKHTRGEDALSFEVPLTFDVPGVYKLQQNSYFSEDLFETEIFVKIPRTESNIWGTEDVLQEPIIEENPENTVRELIFWFALALVVLLFAEWLLQARGNR